eukprot:gene3214-3691_t
MYLQALLNISTKNNDTNSSAFNHRALNASITYIEVIMILTGLVIFLINLYVITLFIRKRCLCRNSNLLLLSLALSDMLTGIITVPLLVSSTPLRVISVERFKIVFMLADVVTVLSASLIILNLCAITFERYFRICYPMIHVIIVTDTRIIIVIIAIWIVAIAYSFMPFAWLYRMFDENLSKAAEDRVHHNDALYSIVGAFLFIIPVIALVAAFSRMFYAIYRLGEFEGRSATFTAKESARKKRENKAVFIFSLMFAVFLICWAPWIILRAILSAYPKLFMRIPPVFLNVIMVTRFMSSIVNPILYTIHKHDFNRFFHSDASRLRVCLLDQRYCGHREESPNTFRSPASHTCQSPLVTNRSTSNSKRTFSQRINYLQVSNGQSHARGNHNHNSLIVNGEHVCNCSHTGEEFLDDSCVDSSACCKDDDFLLSSVEAKQRSTTFNSIVLFGDDSVASSVSNERSKSEDICGEEAEGRQGGGVQHDLDDSGMTFDRLATANRVSIEIEMIGLTNSEQCGINCSCDSQTADTRESMHEKPCNHLDLPKNETGSLLKVSFMQKLFNTQDQFAKKGKLRDEDEHETEAVCENEFTKNANLSNGGSSARVGEDEVEDSALDIPPSGTSCKVVYDAEDDGICSRHFGDNTLSNSDGFDESSPEHPLTKEIPINFKQEDCKINAILNVPSMQIRIKSDAVNLKKCKIYGDAYIERAVFKNSHDQANYCFVPEAAMAVFSLFQSFKYTS